MASKTTDNGCDAAPEIVDEGTGSFLKKKKTRQKKPSNAEARERDDVTVLCLQLPLRLCGRSALVGLTSERGFSEPLRTCWEL